MENFGGKRQKKSPFLFSPFYFIYFKFFCVFWEGENDVKKNPKIEKKIKPPKGGKFRFVFPSREEKKPQEIKVLNGKKIPFSRCFFFNSPG